MRLLLVAFFISPPLFACFCVNTATPCTGIGDSTLVFVGKVLIDSGEGWGTGPASVLIEEPLFHISKDLREVEIDTSAGTSCYYRLEAGEQYVIFAEKSGKAPSRLRIGACSNTFLLQGNEHILDALRNKSRGGSSVLVGTVFRSTGPYSHEGGISGVTVVARSATARYEAASDAIGRYEIQGIAPDRYEVEASRTGFVPDLEFNHQWSGRMVLNKDTNAIEVDTNGPAWSIGIGERSCEVRNLSLWPQGKISGIVVGETGAPVSEITVRAFAFDGKGERESTPLRTGKTDAIGRYVIEPLPPGEYVVGVNAESYSDTEAYPPTVFGANKDSSRPTRVRLEEGGQARAINLVLPAKRSLTKLRVEVLDPSGDPHRGATVTLENLAGVQRFFSRETTSADGVLEIPVYVDEKYIVKVFDFTGGPKGEQGYDYLGGSSPVDVSEAHPAITIVLGPKLLRDEL
jgi:hypothetical protein